MNNNQNGQLTFPIQPVEEPILCSPFEEPNKYWIYDRITGRPSVMDGRRSAGYWIGASYGSPGQQLTLGLADQEGWLRLPLVEKLRKDVRKWRDSDYRNATPITKQLLRYWRREEREKQLFYCQLEAIETIVYIVEIRRSKKQLSFTPEFEEEDLEQLRDSELIRYGCKMATGSGKTVVMAMLIAWTFCNRGKNSADTRFPSAVLAVCPNLTIRDRLVVLRPGETGNYYDKFDLVPPELQMYFMCGRVKVTNWHQLQIKSPHTENGKSYRVVDKGEETVDAYTKRILDDLAEHGEIMVLNDEGHHAYRPIETEVGLQTDEQKQATIWIQGLDRLQSTCGIRFAVDLSATPFYLQGSGHEEGKPFEWIVSDFGLGDAIESGITKIPRIPLDSKTGQPDEKLFLLWQHITGDLGTNPSAEDIYVKASHALRLLAAQWKEQFKENSSGIPNCMIIVCPETRIAEEFHRRISGEKSIEGKVVYGTGELFSELENRDGVTNTLRIDSKRLAEEGRDADALRSVVSTIGKKEELGEQIRCVISVSMLNEGWDANNVTQILGLRAFQSQLLCEQVVGRGLRRMSYDVDPETNRLSAEYVDIYGIPFSMIPMKGRPSGPPPPPKPVFHVHALRERKRAHQIRFPNVIGYSFDLQHNAITVNVKNMKGIKLDENLHDNVTVGAIALDKGSYVHVGPPVKHTLQAFFDAHPFRTTLFHIVAEILEKLPPHVSRQKLFPQLFQYVEVYTRDKIDYGGIDRRVLWDFGCRRQVVDMFLNTIQPDQKAGETPLIPILNPSKRLGSSNDVDFFTTKDCYPTQKSHLNLVAVDSGWEGATADQLEHSNYVKSYVRNERLGFIIRYHFENAEHDYYPDFVVQLKNNVNLVLEIKGKERKKDPAKYEAAKRWCDAVNYARKYGVWSFEVCERLHQLRAILERQTTREIKGQPSIYSKL